MSFIDWDDKYSVHIQAMDEHHQKLMTLINTLYRGVFECGDIAQERELTQAVLDELVSYAEYHFQAEEQLLSEAEYPVFEEHADAHRRFESEIEGLSQQIESGEFALSFAVFEFLRNWLTDHILVNDMQYSSWLRERESYRQGQAAIVE